MSLQLCDATIEIPADTFLFAYPSTNDEGVVLDLNVAMKKSFGRSICAVYLQHMLGDKAMDLLNDRSELEKHLEIENVVVNNIKAIIIRYYEKPIQLPFTTRLKNFMWDRPMSSWIIATLSPAVLGSIGYINHNQELSKTQKTLLRVIQVMTIPIVAFSVSLQQFVDRQAVEKARVAIRAKGNAAMWAETIKSKTKENPEARAPVHGNRKYPKHFKVHEHVKPKRSKHSKHSKRSKRSKQMSKGSQ